jgi:bacterioferritin-associated ferredoxin
VTKRKVVNFLRVEKPVRVGQLSECFGAGTGCGWCRPYLRQLFQQAADQGDLTLTLPSREAYEQMRCEYLARRDADRPGSENEP